MIEFIWLGRIVMVTILIIFITLCALSGIAHNKQEAKKTKKEE